jgi:hypothetical protein
MPIITIFFHTQNSTTMANYALSVLAKGQSVVSAKNQAPEQRRKVPTVMELALKNQEFSIPNANELRKSDLRTVEINYLKNVTKGSSTNKAAVHTGTYGDSGKVELTYITHVETMSLPRKIAQNNIFDYQTLFNNLYEMKWKNLRQRHDDSALAFLIANRCQLAASVIEPQIASARPGTWNETLFALEIEAGKSSRFAQKIKSFMAARLFNSAEYDVIADLQMADEFEFQRNQGAANQTNLSNLFSGLNIATTSDVVSSDYENGAVLIMPKGMLAALQWNDELNKKGVNSGENEVGMLGIAADPFGSGATADISMYTKRADTSANIYGGSPQDINDEWEISLTMAYALPPLATSGESVVHLVGQSS